MSHGPQVSLSASDPRTGRIVAQGLSRRFGSKQALAPFDIEIGPGGVTGLLGPNGSGKSTLLRTLTGLVRPDAGRAEIDGVPLGGDGTALRRRCTYVPGEVNVYKELRGSEHLAWFMRGRERRALERALEMAGELGLPLRARVRTYSHGMKRQLMFCAGMAPEVPVRLFDEPTEGLDPSKRARVIELLREDAARGTTIFLSSHHFGEVDRLCDRVLFMNEGAVFADESSTEVMARARRLVRLGYPQDTPLEPLSRRLSEAHDARLVIEGNEIVVHLEGDDPRPFFAALAKLTDVPQPSVLEYGRISLNQLYRDLYGVEGF